MWIANGWKEYEVIDTSCGEKLERWGKYLLVRPDPQVIWDTPKTEPGWRKMNAHYHRSSKGGGEWEFFDLPQQWDLHYKNLTFHLKPFSFKHTGLFPEQAANWDWFGDKIRKTGSRMPIFRFACIFSNAAYMGFPLISALFGSEGLLYASAYVTVFNILLWTLGYGLVSGGSSVKEVARSLVRTPVLYAIVVGLGIYLLQIPLPTLITQPLELLAGVNTPLSMLITGMLIDAGDVRSIVTDKHIWKLASVRMLLIPAATLALFGVLGFHGTAAQVVTLLECCPAAAITSVFAVQFGHDEHFAAGSVVLTTLLSIVTLPLCALIITMVM